MNRTCKTKKVRAGLELQRKSDRIKNQVEKNKASKKQCQS